MITVIGMALIMFIFVTFIAAQSINNFRQTRRQRIAQQSLHVADAGLERALYEVAQNPNFYTTTATPPTPGSATERSWAITQANALTPTYSADGDWVIVRSQASPTIYSVGYSPSKTNPVRIRVIRASFDNGPALQGYAILTNDYSGLTLANSLTVTGLGGVHTNGNLTSTATGSVEAAMTAVGSYSVAGGMSVGAGSGGGRPKVTVPDVKPRDHYSKSQFDLCPDGSVRKGPAYPGGGGSTSSTPCQGSVVQTTSSFSFRGWRMTGTTASKGAIWTNDTRGYDGVFYIYQGSASIVTDKLQHTNWTVIAEGTQGGTGPGGCPVTGGDIEMIGSGKTHHVSYYPTASPFFFIAGRDLKIDAEWHPAMNNAVMIAHEQFYISAKTVKLTGTLIAYDKCNTTGSPVSANYIGSAEVKYGGYSLPPGEPRLYNWAEI